ncbi:gliding motility lipoprotein GldB [Lutibacter sp.]|uniref:gliding motility lipoprotein GldB n=1 Tax=Lutibacter sp. TaxID=1925666 RepID=UPI003569C586
MYKTLILLGVLLVAISCSKESKEKIDVSKIDVTVKIDRFEQKFYNSNLETLPELKEKYPYLFPEQNADSVWIQKINDIEERELYQKSQELFNDFEEEKKQLEDLFKHIKYYHPNFKEPKILTLITNLDYQSKVMYVDSLLFISLDMYLGRNNEVYHDFPKYLSQNYDRSHLKVDIAEAISSKFFIKGNSRQFIDLIIDEGKKMYMLDTYLPFVSDAEKIGYSKENIIWVTNNETEIWKYFVEKKLLYSTDTDLTTRFILNAPFSKFYIDIDKESPGRVGVWLGWQIVRAYMKNNHVTLQQLLETPAEIIFKHSKYKPKK